MPSLTPQAMTPRCLIVASVCAELALRHNVGAASATAAAAHTRILNPEKCVMTYSRCVVGDLRGGRLMDDHLGADRNTVVKVDDVGIDQPEASRGHGLTDGLRLVGAVN